MTDTSMTTTNKSGLTTLGLHDLLPTPIPRVRFLYRVINEPLRGAATTLNHIEILFDGRADTCKFVDQRDGYKSVIIPFDFNRTITGPDRKIRYCLTIYHGETDDEILIRQSDVVGVLGPTRYYGKVNPCKWDMPPHQLFYQRDVMLDGDLCAKITLQH